MVKKLFYLIIAIFLFGCNKNNDETSPTINKKEYIGDIINPEVSELETFLNEKYTIVKGNIELNDYEDISELKYFDNLKEIEGSLIINKIPISSLSGLNNLHKITGNLQLQNLSLSSINELSNLDTVGGLLELRNLPIADLSAFSKIKSLRSLTISNLEIESLYNLNQDLIIRNSIIITDNSNLQNIGLKNNISSLDGDLMIVNNVNLESFGGFSELKEIQGFLWLILNPEISSLSEFNKITNIAGDLIIDSYKGQNIDGFINLLEIGGSLSVKENEYLNSIDGFESLERIHENLLFLENPELLNLNGLNQLKKVGFEFALIHNRKLESMVGFNSQIDTIGTIRIEGNSELYDFCNISEYVLKRGNGDYYQVNSNLYNPQYIDFLNGDCMIN